MQLFKTKKQKEEEAAKAAEESKRAQYAKIVKMMEIKLPPKGKEQFTPPKPAEYKQFLAEVKPKPATLFERAAAAVEKILPIKPPNEIARKLSQNINASYITATPTGVFTLAIITTIALLIPGILAIALGVGVTLGIFIMAAILGAGFYIYSYPAFNARVMLMRMSADTVLAVLYMIVYMRASPNIEGGLKFAAENLEGPLSWDLKKLMWDIEVGAYASADAALITYVEKWKDKNVEFAEALNMLRGIAVEPARREILFQETLNVILNGTRERTKHYAAGLRMPMMLVHAMGVLLPVMGLVLFPVVMIFMADVVKPWFIFFGYNVLLPITLYFFLDYVLSTKPPTFSQPDISKAKGIAPMGHIIIGGTVLPVWPFAAAVALPILFGSTFAISDCLAPPPELMEACYSIVFSSVNFSMGIISALALGIIVYVMLDAWQKMKMRQDIERIEDEFTVALFQLGNTVSGGAPLEVALDKAVIALKDMKIAELFKIATMNMKKFGMTFEQSLFDSNVGAIWHYPSRLITSVMRTVIESSKKSLSASADAMITISNYLKGVHDVKEEMNEILGETVSSMKFLAMFLAPMVAGVTVTMAVIILQILTKMGATIPSIVGTGGGSMTALQSGLLFPSMAGGGLPISPAAFQLIVGLYMVQTAFLLALFTNRVQYGEDAVGERWTVGITLIFGLIIYVVTWMAAYSMFGGSIAQLLTPTM